VQPDSALQPDAQRCSGPRAKVIVEPSRNGFAERELTRKRQFRRARSASGIGSLDLNCWVYRIYAVVVPAMGASTAVTDPLCPARPERGSGVACGLCDWPAAM
jgi:hypothetical protein